MEKGVFVFVSFMMLFVGNVCSKAEETRSEVGEKLPLLLEIAMPCAEMQQFDNRDFIISSFLSNNARKFFPEDLAYVSQCLREASDDEILSLTSQSYLDPMLMEFVSVFVGGFGIDRFMLGQVGAGVLKLITGGGLGIWWLIDLFQVQSLTKERNIELFDEVRNINFLVYGY